MKLLPREWKNELARLFRSATRDLLIVTPYFTSFGTRLLAESVSAGFLPHGRITFLTDLSPSNICAGAAQPAALIPLQDQVPRLQVIHLPNLHAKLYIADNTSTIVTSGNLTAGGLVHNHEYGLLIEIEGIISNIRGDINELATLGAEVSSESLRTYAQIAVDLVTKYEKKLKSARTELTREFEQAFRPAEDELVAFRLAGGPITTVFERTVIYLLRKYGPLPTQQIHPMIKTLHPDLCDDSIDRVINGQHFGKKWKHAVRRAQSHLKDRGDIELVQGLWRIK
jgi:phospholipase D-like protein